MIWLVILILMGVSFTFSGIEAGILSVNRVRLRHRVKSGEKTALKLDRLLSHPERMLVSVLLITNLMNILAVSLSTMKLVRLIGWPGYLVSGLIWMPVYLLGLGLFPKSVFRRFPYRALALFTEMLRVTDLILSPVLWIGSQLYRFIIKEGAPWKLFVGREDLKDLTLESERSGKLNKTSREMIHSVMDFCSVTVRDVMIPMREVQSVFAGASVNELLALSLPHNLDRVPVVNNVGEVTGSVDVCDVLLERAPGKVVGVFQRRVVFVSPEELAFEALQKMRAEFSGLAVVSHPGNPPLGILQLEDLISRLVKRGTITSVRL